MYSRIPCLRLSLSNNVRIYSCKFFSDLQSHQSMHSSLVTACNRHRKPINQSILHYFSCCLFSSEFPRFNRVCGTIFLRFNCKLFCIDIEFPKLKLNGIRFDVSYHFIKTNFNKLDRILFNHTRKQFSTR